MQWIFWLIAIIVSAGAGYWVYTADKKRAVPYPWLTALLRSLVVFFILLLLLVPTFIISRNETQKPVVVLLQDNSRSVGVALGNDSANYRKNVEALTAKLADKYKVVQWGFGGTVQNDSIFNYHQSATDISMVLSRAQEYFGLQNLGAVILATDGRFNQGINPMFQQLSLKGSLYAVALGDSAAQKDIRISQAYANKVVSLNSEFEIRADIVSALCKGYNNGVSLQEAGSTISTVPLAIGTDRFDRSVSFNVKADRAGLHHYVITVPVADGEKNTANNRKDIFVEVTEQKKNILILAGAPHPDIKAISEALGGLESYKVTVKTADNIPASLNDYQVVILHGLPSVQYGNLFEKLQAAKKPVWFIITSQTDIAQLLRLQNAVQLRVVTSAMHDVQANYNTAFGLFTLPQNTQSVLDKMPPLSVPAGSIQPMANASVLFSQKENSAPLWVFQQGNTPSAMLMGEGVWRWRLYEYKNFGKHDIVDECIRQTVAFLSANNEKPFKVSVPKYVWSDQESITLNGYLLNANNEQINTPDVKLVITDSAGRKQNYSFERAGNAYALNIGIRQGGTYTYAAYTNYNNKPYSESGTFVVETQPLELMESGADYPLLYGLARKYNGAFVPGANVGALYDSISHNENIKPVIQTTTETVPLVDWKWYFFLILLLAAGEWLLRKYWLAQ